MTTTKVTNLLEALQHGDHLLTAVETLVRESRRMLDAFNAGDPSRVSSRGMEEALAAFEGWEPRMEVRGF